MMGEANLSTEIKRNSQEQRSSQQIGEQKSALAKLNLNSSPLEHDSDSSATKTILSKVEANNPKMKATPKASVGTIPAPPSSASPSFPCPISSVSSNWPAKIPIKSGKKAYVRFDEYLDLSEENLRRSCKRLMNHLYCAPSFNLQSSSTFINSSAKPIPINVAPSAIRGLASSSEFEPTIFSSSLLASESLTPVSKLSMALALEKPTITVSKTMLAKLKQAGNRAPLCGEASENCFQEQSLESISNFPITAINTSQSTLIKAANDPAATQLVKHSSGDGKTTGSANSNAKSYLQSQYERRQQRHIESFSKQQESKTSNCLEQVHNHVNLEHPSGGRRAERLRASSLRRDHQETFGASNQLAGPIPIVKQDTLTRSHELSKRRFFEKLEQRELLKRNQRDSSRQLGNGSIIGACDTSNCRPRSSSEDEEVDSSDGPSKDSGNCLPSQAPLLHEICSASRNNYQLSSEVSFEPQQDLEKDKDSNANIKCEYFTHFQPRRREISGLPGVCSQTGLADPAMTEALDEWQANGCISSERFINVGNCSDGVDLSDPNSNRPELSNQNNSQSSLFSPTDSELIFGGETVKRRGWQGESEFYDGEQSEFEIQVSAANLSQFSVDSLDHQHDNNGAARANFSTNNFCKSSLLVVKQVEASAQEIETKRFKEATDTRASLIANQINQEDTTGKTLDTLEENYGQAQINRILSNLPNRKEKTDRKSDLRKTPWSESSAYRSRQHQEEQEDSISKLKLESEQINGDLCCVREIESDPNQMAMNTNSQTNELRDSLMAVEQQLASNESKSPDPSDLEPETASDNLDEPITISHDKDNGLKVESSAQSCSSPHLLRVNLKEGKETTIRGTDSRVYTSKPGTAEVTSNTSASVSGNVSLTRASQLTTGSGSDDETRQKFSRPKAHESPETSPEGEFVAVPVEQSGGAAKLSEDADVVSGGKDVAASLTKEAPAPPLVAIKDLTFDQTSEKLKERRQIAKAPLYPAGLHMNLLDQESAAQTQQVASLHPVEITKVEIRDPAPEADETNHSVEPTIVISEHTLATTSSSATSKKLGASDESIVSPNEQVNCCNEARKLSSRQQVSQGPGSCNKIDSGSISEYGIYANPVTDLHWLARKIGPNHDPADVKPKADVVKLIEKPYDVVREGKEPVESRRRPLIESLYVTTMSLKQNKLRNAARNSQRSQNFGANTMNIGKLIEEDGGSSCSSSGFGASSSSDGCASIKKDHIQSLLRSNNDEMVVGTALMDGLRSKCGPITSVKDYRARPTSIGTIDSCATSKVTSHHDAGYSIYDCVRGGLPRIGNKDDGGSSSEQYQVYDKAGQTSRACDRIVGPGQPYPQQNTHAILVENQNYATFFNRYSEFPLNKNDDSCSHSVVSYANLQQHQADYAARANLLPGINRAPIVKTMDKSDKSTSHREIMRNLNSQENLSERSCRSSSDSAGSGGFSALPPVDCQFSQANTDNMETQSLKRETKYETSSQRKPSLLKRFGSLVSRALAGASSDEPSPMLSGQSKFPTASSCDSRNSEIPLDKSGFIIDSDEAEVNRSADANAAPASDCLSTFKLGKKSSQLTTCSELNPAQEQQVAEADLVILPAKHVNQQPNQLKARLQQQNTELKLKLSRKNDDRLSRELRRAARKAHYRLSVSESRSLTSSQSTSGSSSCGCSSASSSSWTRSSASSLERLEVSRHSKSVIQKGHHLHHRQHHHHHHHHHGHHNHQRHRHYRSSLKHLKRVDSFAEELESLMSRSECSSPHRRTAQLKQPRPLSAPKQRSFISRRIVDIDSVSPSIKKGDQVHGLDASNSTHRQLIVIRPKASKSSGIELTSRLKSLRLPGTCNSNGQNHSHDLEDKPSKKQEAPMAEKQEVTATLTTEKELHRSAHDKLRKDHESSGEYSDSTRVKQSQNFLLHHAQRKLKNQARDEGSHCKPHPIIFPHPAEKKFGQDKHQWQRGCSHSLHEVNNEQKRSSYHHGGHGHRGHKHRHNRDHRNHPHSRHARDFKLRQVVVETSTSRECPSDHELASNTASKKKIWGQLIKINMFDGSQLIELQRLPDNSWGFFVARGSINDTKGIFISRMEESNSLTGLLSIGDRVIAIDGYQIEHDQDISEVNQLISNKCKVLLKVKPFKG